MGMGMSVNWAMGDGEVGMVCYGCACLSYHPIHVNVSKCYVLYAT